MQLVSASSHPRNLQHLEPSARRAPTSPLAIDGLFPVDHYLDDERSKGGGQREGGGRSGAVAVAALLREAWRGRARSGAVADAAQLDEAGAEPSPPRRCSRRRGAEGRGAEPSPTRRSSMRRGAKVEINDGANAVVLMLGGPEPHLALVGDAHARHQGIPTSHAAAVEDSRLLLREVQFVPHLSFIFQRA